MTKNQKQKNTRLPIAYLIGKITKVGKDFIYFENNYIGYCLLPLDNINNYHCGSIVKLYIIDFVNCSLIEKTATSNSTFDVNEVYIAMKQLGYQLNDIEQLKSLDFSIYVDVTDAISYAIKFLGGAN